MRRDFIAENYEKIKEFESAFRREKVSIWKTEMLHETVRAFQTFHLFQSGDVDIS